MTPLAFSTSVNSNFPNTIISSSSSSSSINTNRYHHFIFPVGGDGGVSYSRKKLGQRWQRVISCAVALKTDSATIDTTTSEADDDGLIREKIGARVRVKVPLKVYHVPKVPELDLTGMVGELKQYVGLWKGKRISANLPFKVAFVTDIPGRGPIKFFAHLKEDEFEYVDDCHHV